MGFPIENICRIYFAHLDEPDPEDEKSVFMMLVFGVVEGLLFSLGMCMILATIHVVLYKNAPQKRSIFCM